MFDQRGHGKSFHPESGYSPEDYAGDLLKILDDLGWSEIHLVGHSMGGRNAINFTYNNAQRVKKLVIEDIGPESGRRSYENIKGMLDLVPTPFSTKKEAREFFNEKFAHLIKEKPNARVLSEYFYTNIEEKASGQADWRFSREGILESLRQGHKTQRWNELESIVCPTLVIRGELSSEFSAEVFQKMLNCNQKFKGVQIEKAGHWVHFDKPREFVNVLQEFFSE